ncbi:oxysterol-binding protein-related protein 11 [Brevipalpus obovatus]|uniref:oxysterol-binding protein-related protein 11 n=1 Tax=Brevipalpus obovatus TaxID=246614 RepID=UPI003D9F8790
MCYVKCGFWRTLFRCHSPVVDYPIDLMDEHCGETNQRLNISTSCSSIVPGNVNPDASIESLTIAGTSQQQQQQQQSQSQAQQQQQQQHGTTLTESIGGLLYKYTNVVKGWQYRYFVLTPSRSTLEYYMSEKKKKGYPRGCIYLAGAVIAPSDEDGQIFTVSAASGEIYKLKAMDTNERRHWVNCLRQVAETHQPDVMRFTVYNNGPDDIRTSLDTVRDMVMQAQKHQRSLVSEIEDFTTNNSDLLVLKSLIASTTMSLEQSYVILHSIERQRLDIK